MRKTFPYENHHSPAPSTLPAKLLGWGYEKYEIFQIFYFVDKSFCQAYKVKCVQVIDKIIAHQFGCESSSVKVKYPKESVIYTRFTLGQACLSFVVLGIVTGANVRKLAESRLNRANTAAVRGIGERFVREEGSA